MTTRWGDVAPVFQQPSPAQLVQPNFVDVDAEFKKIERIPGSSNKVQLQLQPNVPNPTRTVNVMDAALVEDAYQGLQYFFSGPTSCGSEQRETHPPPEQNHNAGLSSPFLRGGQTPTLYVTPVLPQGSIVYPPGTSIIGQELHARTGGFRAFFNLQISNWDPGSTPTIGIRAYQVGHVPGAVFADIETQLSGAAVMQFGFTMQEKMDFDSGQVTNASLADYKIPSMLDIPPMHNEAVEAEQRSGPFGAKGVGETATFAVSPAIASAIDDAVGVRLTSLPLTAEQVYRALCAARNEPLED
jgi:hypothetical protein